MHFYTIGVYHTTASGFFSRLQTHRIDTFCDIRQRRAVRGAAYAFANSNRLQHKLQELEIRYIHVAGLAPTTAMRELQYKADEKRGIGKRDRQTLSPDFADAYREKVLRHFDLRQFVKDLETANAQRVVLFCVEEKAEACHRWIVAEALNRNFGFSIEHL